MEAVVSPGATELTRERLKVWHLLNAPTEADGEQAIRHYIQQHFSHLNAAEVNKIWRATGWVVFYNGGEGLTLAEFRKSFTDGLPTIELDDMPVREVVPERIEELPQQDYRIQEIPNLTLERIIRELVIRINRLGL